MKTPQPEAPLEILLIDKDPADVRQIREILQDVEAPYFEVTPAPSLQEGRVLAERAHVVLLDLSHRNGEGLQSFFRARDVFELPIVVMSDHADDETALKAVAEGAHDYLVKGVFTGQALARVVRYAVERHRLAVERLRIERALRDSEERYRRFFEEDLAGDCVVDAGGDVVACNPAFAQIFGLESVECAVGVSFRSLIRSPSRDELVGMLEEKGKVERFELRGRNRGGQDVYLIGNAVATRDEAGRVVEFRVYLFDDTERKKTEDQLRQAQKMDAVGRLAGGVAHDFSNILTAIGFHAEFLLRELTDDPRLSQRARDIKSATKRAASLTSQLLAFSRRQVLRPTPLDLNTVITGVIGLFQRVIGEDVQVVDRLGESVGKVEADPSQLEQVILNLVVNARDAMPEGGRLTLETEIVEVSEKRAIGSLAPGSYAMLAVSDTGEGIAPDIRGQVFEPFFTTKHPSRGTGLGLSTVYGIIHQSDGHVAFESEVGRGTTFRVYLPRYRAAAAVQSLWEPSGIIDLPCSETLLVVEDDPSVRKLVLETLENQGFQVLGAGTCKKALEVSEDRGQRIDLVITDVVLPDWRGPDLVVSIKEERPDVKVLYMSGFIDDTTLRRNVETARVPFLAKPFTASQLIVKVREVLDEGPVNVPMASASAEVVSALQPDRQITGPITGRTSSAGGSSSSAVQPPPGQRTVSRSAAPIAGR